MMFGRQRSYATRLQSLKKRELICPNSSMRSMKITRAIKLEIITIQFIISYFYANEAVT